MRQASQEEAATFRGITGHGNNEWNDPKDFYTATINEDNSVKVGFTAADSDEWSTYVFNFDTATIEATKLHIKVRLVGGNLETSAVSGRQMGFRDFVFENGLR